MKLHKDNFDVIFFSRGGQGAKIISEIVAQAAVKEGKFVQAFPYFGPERSGAPTKAFVRISDKEIRTHEPIVDPDIVLVLDETLLTSQDVIKNLDQNESLVVSSTRNREELAKKLPNFKGKIHPIDAFGISLKIIGQPRPNSVILGKFVQVTEIVKLENIIEEFKKVFESKIGKEITDKNIQAIKAGYDAI